MNFYVSLLAATASALKLNMSPHSLDAVKHAHEVLGDVIADEDDEIIDYVLMCEEPTAMFYEYDLTQDGLLTEHDADQHFTTLLNEDDANANGKVDFDEF